MTEVITVVPAQDGWCVRQEASGVSQMFASGAKAEGAARRLGEALARTGQAAEIHIYLRDGSLGGRLVCAPRETIPA